MFEILKKYNFWDGNVKGCGFLRKSYLKKLKELDVTKTIITITGGRRVGKSFLVRQYIDFLINENKIKPKQIFYANLFIRELESLKDPKIFTEAIGLWKKKLKVEENLRKYIIIDEVQEIEKWEILINSLYEDFTTEYKVIITGSNSKLLSGELSTYIAGRSFSLNVLPLSYQEYLDFTQKGISKETFIEYMKDGGMPEIVLAENSFAKNNLISTTIDSIIMRDIVLRHDIRNISLLKKIVDYFCSSPSDEISKNKVANILKNTGLKSSIHTVSDYIEYLKESFLIHSCPVFSYKKNDILKSVPEKVYLNDHSFAMNNSGFKDLGKLLENIVYIELLRKGYKVQTLKIDDKEIDFIAEKETEKMYIQVAYTLGDKDSDTFKREFGNLLLIKDHFPKIVLTLDDILFAPVKGVEHLSIIDFLNCK